MKNAIFGVFLAGVFILSSASSFAQTCYRCKDQGTIACSKHPKGTTEQEVGVPFCSVVGRCATCLGTVKIECPDCKNHGKGIAEAVAETKTRLDKQAAYEKEMGGFARATIENGRFELTFEIENMMIGQKQYDQHQLLHIYSKRLDKLFTDFNELLGLQPDEHRCKMFRVMIWKLPKDQKEASTRYSGGTSQSGSKLLGVSGVFTLYRDRGLLPQDDDLHRSIVHNVTHLLLADLYDGVWIGKKKAGWVDEGLAHWFEDKGFGQCTNFCYQEQNTNISFRGGRWRKPVREMAESGRKPSFAETANKADDELKPEEHALSFSYVDFLLAKDPKAFPQMVRILQQKDKVTRDALKEVYKLSMSEFEQQWKEWVLKNYTEKNF